MEYFCKYWILNRAYILDYFYDEKYIYKTVYYSLRFMVANMDNYNGFSFKTVSILNYPDSNRVSDVLNSLSSGNSSQRNDIKKKFELRESFKYLNITN